MDLKTDHFDNRKLRVLVIDAHTSVSELLGILLDRDGRFSVVDEAATGPEGLKLFRKHKPDMVISDLELPGLNGIEMLRTIRKEKPDLRILVFTGTTNPELIHSAIEINPHGFAHKSESLSVLRQVIGMIYEGHSSFSSYATRLSIQRHSRTSGVANLTSKERVILQLVAEGMSSKEVANQLSLSTKTIEHYRKHLMRKLNIHSVSTLTLYAVKLGLVQV